MRVLGYIRVSSSEQVSSGLGLADQRAAIEARAAALGAELVAIFEDGGKSGGLEPAKRPGLTAALEALRKGDILRGAQPLAPLARHGRHGGAREATREEQGDSPFARRRGHRRRRGRPRGIRPAAADRLRERAVSAPSEREHEARPRREAPERRGPRKHAFRLSSWRGRAPRAGRAGASGARPPPRVAPGRG